MTYLYNKNVNVLNANAIVETTNPFPVVVTGGNTNSQLVTFPKSSTSAFGELSVIENTPDIQMDAVYGFNKDFMTLLSTGSGSAEANADTSMFSANSGTSAGSTATVNSRRFLRYRPGQGAIGRFTAMFTLGDANNKYGIDGATQRVGLNNIGNGYGFGFSGSTANNKARTFGIYHVYNGKPEIRRMTVTTAPTGTQTATVTLNGVAYTIPIYAGTTSNTASVIAAGNTYGGLWSTDCTSNVITFTASTASPRTGTYSFSSSGAGTLANATIVQTQAGIAANTDWTYMEDWEGPYTVTDFDPSKLNVFQVDYRWLGAGLVRFFIEDPISGDLVQVHQQHWANQQQYPHVNIPSFRLGWVAANGGTPPSQPAVVKGASGMGAIQGKLVPTTFSKSWYAVNTTNLGSDTIHHLLSIRNPFQKSDKINTQELLFQDLTVSVQGNDPSIIHIFINANTSDPLSFETMPNTDAYQSSEVGPTIDTSTNLPVTSFTLGVNGTSQFDLTPYRLTLAPGDVLSFAIQSSSTLSRTAVAVTWIPD